MKKVLLSSATVALLLAGCSQGEEAKKENATKTTETTETKSNFVSEKEVKKEFQSYIDNLANEYQKINSNIDSEDMSLLGNTFEEVGDSVDKINKQYQSYLDENKEPIKYTKPSNQMIEMNAVIGKLLKDMGTTVLDFNKGKITEEEATDKINNILGEIETKQKELNDSGNEVEKFLKQEDIDTSKYEKSLGTTSSDSTDTSSSEDSSSDTLSLNPIDDFKSISKKDVNKTINAGPAEFTIVSAEKGTIPVTEDNSFNFENAKVGSDAQVIILNVKLKNTSDANVDYYPDQAPITTDTGEQLDPSMMTDGSLVVEMKGDVESTGKIIYELKNSKASDVHSIEFIAPAYNDPDTMDEISPEQKMEVSF